MDRQPLHPVKSPWAIKHGLYLELEKYKIDGRSALGQALSRSREALAAMFPKGPDAVASILIDQVIYKKLRLELFMNWDMATGEATPTAIQNFLSISTSLRKDLLALTALAKGKPDSDDELKEVLATIKRAAQAQVVRVEAHCEGR
jgi:hypothetical protein